MVTLHYKLNPSSSVCLGRKKLEVKEKTELPILDVIRDLQST